jgi:hypothetical protein
MVITLPLPSYPVISIVPSLLTKYSKSPKNSWVVASVVAGMNDTVGQKNHKNYKQGAELFTHDIWPYMIQLG